MVLETVIKTGR